MLQAASSALQMGCVNPAILFYARHLATRQVTSSLLSFSSSSIGTARSLRSAPVRPVNLSFSRDISYLPENHASTWPAACHELQQNAFAGSEWPHHSRLVLDKVDEQLGGRWLVVQSGKFSPGQPRADQPARALLHVFMCYTRQQGGPLDSPAQDLPQQDGSEPSDAGSSSSSSSSSKQQGVAKPAGKGKSTPEIQPLKKPTKVATLPPGSTPLYYLAVYELNDHHWPTGTMYNSASQFERATTSACYRKPEQSLQVVWEGKIGVTLARWNKEKAGRPEYGMRRVPRTHKYHLANWYKAAVKAVGVEVMEELDAVSLSLAAKKKQRGDSLSKAATGDDAEQ